MSLCGVTHFLEYIAEDALLPGDLAASIFEVSVELCDIDTLGVDDFSFDGLKLAVLLSNVIFFLLFVKEI